jgi:hypothetical protein
MASFYLDKPEEEKKLRIPRRILEDNMQQGRKGVDWIHVTQDTAVNTVMQLRVP